MNIIQILKTFYKHIVLICVSTVIVTLLVITKAFFLTTPTYTSNAQLIANNNTAMISTYKQLITSDKFTSAVSTGLTKRKSISSDQIGNVSVVYTPTSPIFTISYTSSNPKVAVMGANKTAQLFVNNLDKYFAGSAVTIYSQADIPQRSDRAQLKKKIISGLIFGFVLGIILALFIELFSLTIKDSDYAKNILGLNDLGTVHLMSKTKRSK